MWCFTVLPGFSSKKVGTVKIRQNRLFTDYLHWETNGHRRGPSMASAKNTEQISEFRGVWGHAHPRNFFNNTKCCKLGNFFSFCQALGGGMAPLALPWSRLWRGYPFLTDFVRDNQNFTETPRGGGTHFLWAPFPKSSTPP